jgi:hypothetical protein
MMSNCFKGKDAIIRPLCFRTTTNNVGGEGEKF